MRKMTFPAAKVQRKVGEHEHKDNYKQVAAALA